MKNALKGLQKKTQGRSTEDEKLEALANAYNYAMERINGQKPGFRWLAKKVLSWITCAKRPLTTSEVQHALAVNVDDPELDEENVRTIEDMVSVCAGLVMVDEESSVIRLVHYTTQEYFKRTHATWFPNAEKDITIVCITYISFNVFEAGFCRTDEEFETRLRLNPLYDYAARNWGHHACMSSSPVDQLMLDFLESEVKVSGSSQAMMAWGSYTGYSQRVPVQMTGVHIAAYFGLREAIAALVKIGHDPDSKDSNARTPLSWAAENGHEAVMRLLLDKGADMESKDAEYSQTPLSWAAENGHEAAVRLLVDKGADLEPESKDRQTPLWLAARNGHEAVVRLLLEKGVDPESESEDHQTPLYWAEKNGHIDVAELLRSHYSAFL
jgi:hypothetical protein